MSNILYSYSDRSVLFLFQQLQQMIPNSEVGVLSKNSDNVVKLIQDAYHVCCQFTTGKFCCLSPFMYVCVSLKLPFVTNKFFLNGLSISNNILKYVIHDRNCPQK